MKRSALIAAAAAVMMFASCDDNNSGDGEKRFSPADIAGTYEGYANVSFFGTPQGRYEKQTVSITAAEDGKTAALSYVSETWGSFSLEALTVAQADGGYTVSGDGTVSMGMQGQAPKDYEFTLAGTVSSLTDAALTFTIPAVMGGLKIEFITGEAPAGE